LARTSSQELHTADKNKFYSTYWLSREPGSKPGQSVCNTRCIKLLYDLFPCGSHILCPFC